MKKRYLEPEFDLIAFSFEKILEEGDVMMNGSEPEGGGAGTGWD